MIEEVSGELNLKAKSLCFVRVETRVYDEFSEGSNSFSIATYGFLGCPMVVAACAAFRLCTHSSEGMIKVKEGAAQSEPVGRQ